MKNNRSQWARSLRHELSSPTETLRSWVRIHSRHGYLYMFLLCFCCPVLVAALRRALIPVQRFLPTVYKIHISILILMVKQARGA
jgi:hypothetical protein